MTTAFKKILLSGFFLTTVYFIPMACISAPNSTEITLGRFRKVHIYRQTPQPGKVVLFISGDGGWNLGVIHMAKILASMDALVAGIDINSYLKALARSKEKCVYPAADFESLSHYIQKKFNYTQYVQPVLAGYSSGATLVYAVIAQAPANTFKAGISMGFCPNLILPKIPCKGSGLAWHGIVNKTVYLTTPNNRIPTPWLVLQGKIDQVCRAQPAKDFAVKISTAQFVLLPKVGHGFSVARNWVPQLKRAFADVSKTDNGKHIVAGQTTNSLADLPLVEIPAANNNSSRRQMAVIVSGDGGWADIDQQMANGLTSRGIPTVGLNSLKYFWTARKPDTAAHDLERILNHYTKTWDKDKIILVGYSMGADVLPFMVTRLPEQFKSRIQLVALLAPGLKTAFEFFLSDWIGANHRAKRYPLLPEIEKLNGIPTSCFFGQDEKGSLCSADLPPSVKINQISGGHHFNGQYQLIIQSIIQTIDSDQRRF